MEIIYKYLINKISVPSEKKTKQKDYLKNGRFPVVDQSANFISGYYDDITRVIKSDKPVIVFGDHTCNVKFVNFDFVPGADGIKAYNASDNVIPKFLYYGTIFLVLNLEDRGYGRHFQFIEKMKLNVPSREKQQLIVDRIEELFSELDKAEETLLKTKAQLEVYKQAVLKEAFDFNCNMQPVRNATDLVTSGSRGWAKYYCEFSKDRFVRITDLTRDNIILKNNAIQYLDLPANVEGVRSKLEPGDILVSITADLGSIAIVPENIGDAYINQHIAVMRLKNKNQSEFIAWYLKSEKGHNDLLKNQRGNGKAGLGLDDVRNTLIPMVDDETANSILENLKAKMTYCEVIKETIVVNLAKIISLRQSILKETFEGKLV